MATTSEQILNAIRNGASEEYQDRIPEATRDNISEVGNAIIDYEPTKNEFLDTLINKIALTIINSKMAENKFGQFYGETIEYGDTVEEIFVDLIKAEKFDPNFVKVFEKKKPTVKTLYHKIDVELKYKVTIEEVLLRRAFRSGDGVAKLASAIINQLYSSKTYDEYLHCKELIGTYSGAKVIEVEYPDDTDSTREFLRALKKVSTDMQYMSDEYNESGVKTYTASENCVIFIHKDIKINLDLDLLAKVFNTTATALNARLIEVDNFGSQKNRLAMICDSDIFRIHKTLDILKSTENGEALYTNYVLHSHGIFSLSKFKNCVALDIAEVTPAP